MNEKQLFLTDYLSNKRSLEKLKKQFASFSNCVNYLTFKEIIVTYFPEIARENEKIIEERVRVKCFRSKFVGRKLQEDEGIQRTSSSASLSYFSELSWSKESSVESDITSDRESTEEPVAKETEYPSCQNHKQEESAIFNDHDVQHSFSPTTRPSFLLRELLQHHRIGAKGIAKNGEIPLFCSSQEEMRPLTTSTACGNSEVSVLTCPAKKGNLKKNESDIGYGTKASLRHARLCSKAELAREIIAEPLKEVFNHIDRRNNLNIQWEDVLHYLIEESIAKTTSFNQTCRAYSFSRKMKNNKVEESWMLQSKESTDGNASKKKRGKKTKLEDCTSMVKTAWRPFTPIVVPPFFFLPRLIHSLPGHWVFALSTRSTPLALYRKSDLLHVKTFNSAELGYSTPTFLEYLPRSDTILYYSSVDSLLRGWTFLLSKNNSTSMVPLRIEGTVQKMKTSPLYFPFSVFLATANGGLVRVDVPSYRSGTDLRVVREYKGLHNCNSGGILDFAISETAFYTTGFDHRVLSIHIQTGHVTVIGNAKVCIYLLDYCPMFSLVIGASYQNELLYWDAKGLAAVPGTPFNCVHQKRHYHWIKKLICVNDLSHCVTIDCYGEVKMWDLKALECVQTIRVDGRSTDAVDAESIYLVKSSSASLTDKLMEPVVDVVYFEESHELVSCTKDTLYLLQYNLREDMYICDLDQVTQIFYDVRERTFLLKGSTRFTTWDASCGVRKSFLDRAFLTDIAPARKDILAFCVDDVGSRIFLSLHTKEIEVYDTKNSSHPIEVLRIPVELSEMLYSSYYKLLLGLSEDGKLFSRNEEEKVPFNLVSKIAQGKLYSLSISETLGLLACCCSRGCLYLHDLRKIDSAPQSCRLNKYILSCVLLDSVSILASSHERGDIALWSCPPIAEVFLQLIVFNVFVSNPSTLRSSTQKVVESPPECFGEEPSFSITNFSMETKRVTSPTIRKVEGEWSQSSFLQSCGDMAICMGEEKKEINDAFLEHFSKIVGRQREITAMAFDSKSHNFFCSDSSGFLHFFSLCPFFQWFGIKSPTLENRYFLDHSLIGCKAGMPVLLNTIRPHSKEGVITIQWIPYENVLLTSGVDRKVLLFRSDGNMCGVLSKVRLPTSSHSRDDYSKNFTDGSSTQLKREDLPLYELPTCKIQDKETTAISSQNEAARMTGEYFCGHAPISFPELQDELSLHERLSSTKKMTSADTSEAQQNRSFSLSRYKTKKMSCTRLGDFVSSRLITDIPLPDGENSCGDRREVIIKASLGKKLASLQICRPKKLSERKVMMFPSTLHRETLSDIEERRPHSAAAVQKICPILFAFESESPAVGTPLYSRNVVMSNDVDQKKTEKEQALLRQANSTTSLCPPLVPTLPPGASPFFVATKKKPLREVSDSPLQLSLSVKRIQTHQEGDSFFSDLLVRKSADEETYMGIIPRVESKKGQICVSSPRNTTREKMGTLYRGKCSQIVSAVTSHRLENERLGSQWQSSTGIKSKRISEKEKKNKKMGENAKSCADKLLEEYSRELNRCLAGERGKTGFGWPSLNTNSRGSPMGSALKKMDRPFQAS